MKRSGSISRISDRVYTGRGMVLVDTNAVSVSYKPGMKTILASDKAGMKAFFVEAIRKNIMPCSRVSASA